MVPKTEREGIYFGELLESSQLELKRELLIGEKNITEPRACYYQGTLLAPD